ncbi:MAG: FtsX-like permease family protein [Ilumatobacter sp.]|uniref:ABC transporter permease n=1 Tax=Ilumatobacter sp. TaxID=1967498 RepID=UPI002612C552|nr:ABC transporter permease [Ilumatobacter sp.]MDJ0769731.1 FtsX-like permease family protein [Ilumatobacter sp.]
MTSWVLVAVVSTPFLVALAADPVTRRLAFRYPRRRVVEGLLVVLGSLLGTGIITGSLVVGDTIDRSIRSSAYDQLGPIDEVVSVSGLGAGAALVERVGALERIEGADGVLDGVLSLVTTPVSVVGERVQPRAQLIEVDFDAARRFGSDPSIVGLPGDTPTPGDAAITVDLAARTGARPGDTLTVFVYGVGVDVVVDRILERTGVAGFWPVDDRQQAYNVFVTPGSLAEGLRGVTLPPEVAPPETFVTFSNVGDVESGLPLTDRAVEIIEAAVGDDVAVRAEKRDVIEAADTAADSLTQLYFTMGMFAVAAGILLLVNIFVMLADERRSQLGMLRALGMRRRSLVMAFASEGWLYALVSSLVGALVGIQLGRLISWRADQILTSGDDVFSLHLTFSYDASTVVQGFAIGLAISVVTIVLTSVRISRLNVIAAIRDLPVTGAIRHRRRWRLVGLVVALTGVAWSVLSFGTEEGYGVAVAPMVAATGAGLVALGPLSGRAVTTWVGALVLVWGALFVAVHGWMGIETGIPIFLVQGLTMCAAAVSILMVHHKQMGRWLSERFGGNLPVKVGLAYPMARSFRTAMTLGMFGIVILTIVYVSFISLMFRNQAEEITADLSGGFDIVVTTNPSDPPDLTSLAAVEGVTGVAPLAYGLASTEFADRADDWPITGFGSALAAAPPTLLDAGDYESDAAAWAAVLDDPDLIIVDEFLLSNAGPVTDLPEPGDPVEIADPVTGASRTVTIAAISTADFLWNGSFYGIDGYRELYGERSAASRFYVASAMPDRSADLLGTTFAPNGAEANVIRDTVDQLLAQNTGFFTLMQQFVGVGLLVGIAGLGVVMVRSVRERRRDVGVLRAIGLEPRPVARSFLLEATFVATEAVLIGIAVAMIGTYGLVWNGTGFAEGMEWTVPWRDIAVVGGLTLVAAALTAGLPARQAGRIQPARALRMVE